MSSGRNYRATKRNFLPPPKKSDIINSDSKFTDGQNHWLFDRDLPPEKRFKRYKDWALFSSDQWDSRWLIAYTTYSKENESSLPQMGERIALLRKGEVGSFIVVKAYPTKRVCRTYILQLVK